MSLNENERRRRQNHTTRRKGRPTAITAAHAPGDPRRGPLDAWDPDPSKGRVIDPPAIVIASPRPRLIARPVPAAIGPDPMPVTVRPPRHGQVRWTPTASVVTHFDPRAVRSKRFIK